MIDVITKIRLNIGDIIFIRFLKTITVILLLIEWFEDTLHSFIDLIILAGIHESCCSA